MNYFYFFFFLLLASFILIKPLAKIISNWIIASEKLTKTGLLTVLIGVVCIVFSIKGLEAYGAENEFWYERTWQVITFSIGILLVLRGLVIILFLNSIKNNLTFFMKHYYKFAIPVSIFLTFISFVAVSNDYIGPQKDISSSCTAEKNIRVICGFSNPEDIVITPDNKFLLMSEFGGIGPYEDQKPGFFALLDLETEEKIIPTISIAENNWGDPECKRGIGDKYGPHGIDLIKRKDGSFQLGVISHYPNETIEMFELIKINNEWSLIWRGCINVPYEYYFNDISLKEDGEFFASHMYKRDITLNEWLITSLLKSNSGFLVKWENNTFRKIPNTEGSGPNGIAFDEEAGLMYINYNQGDKIVSFDINKNKIINSQYIEAPDNPYIDGIHIWITSLDFQPNDFGECEFRDSCSLPFSIYKLDRESLKIVKKYSFSKSIFGLPTVAVPVEDEVYMGSFHSDRIGVFQHN